MEYDNTNRGALFKNNDKEDEKHPDYRGNINVDGTEFWLSAWVNTSKAGMKYMSLVIKPKDERPKGDAARPKKKTAGGGPARPEFDDSVPFAPEVR